MNVFSLLPWWGWLVGTLGIGGVVLLIVLAPALAALIWERVTELVVAALKTPIGAGLIAGAVMFGIGWTWSGIRAGRQCNATIEQMKIDSRRAADKRDAKIRNEVERKYQPIVQSLQQQADDREQKVKDYETQIVAKDRAKCVLGPDVLRLRP